MRPTLIDLMIWIVIVAMVTVGARLGFQVGGYVGGAAGIVLGASCGILVGYLANRLFNILTVRSVRRKSTPALRAQLNDGFTDSTYVSSLIISVLIERGESVAGFREYIVRQLRSPYVECRRAGWCNLGICYPQFAATIEGFDPFEPSSEHLSRLAEIEQVSSDD